MKKGAAGGKAVLRKYGPDHFRELGRKGFQVTTERYFAGDRRRHVRWLSRKGAFVVDSQTSYHKPEVFPDPGPHPAHKALVDWLNHTEENIP